MAEQTEYDREAEMVEVSVNLFVASMSLEEGNERAYLEFLRKAQAHLTGLVLDAEEHPAQVWQSNPDKRINLSDQTSQEVDAKDTAG